jgi:hypothetical protein
MNRTPLPGVLLVISSVFVISCGGEGSLSPTAPSRSGVGGQTGAVIIGQVNAPFRSTTAMLATSDMFATAGTLATTDSASVTVKVVGTNISTTTDGRGLFTLTGVAPGEVKLEFTGAGGTATISISGVRADDEIRISVTLNGTNARVDSERRNKRFDNNRQDQAELKGVVSGLTGTCPNVSFTVQNWKVTASETTQFEDVTCGDIKNGMVVEVNGSRQSDGSIKATKVEGDDDDVTVTNATQVEAKGAVSGFTGTCPKVSFTVRTIKVNTSETTRFEDIRCAAIQDGTEVEVTGTRQADGSITATKVEIDD